MMKNRLFRSLAAASLAVMLVLAGCSQGGEPSSSVAENSSSSEPESVPTIYIGTYEEDGSESFTAYPYVSSGETTPEELIQAMAELTGWDLTLSADDPVTSGKGGMTVSFAPESAIFTGPPTEQKEEFHMFSADQLCTTIFDSVQKTLQENFSPANPEALDIYYCTDGSTEIQLDNLGIVLPIEEPYSHSLFQQLLLSANQSSMDSLFDDASSNGASDEPAA